jgi:hypothetical protein
MYTLATQPRLGPVVDKENWLRMPIVQVQGSAEHRNHLIHPRKVLGSVREASHSEVTPSCRVPGKARGDLAPTYMEKQTCL